MSESVPSGLLFSKDHEWVMEEDGVVTIGISQYAQEALGDMVYVELPEVGSTVEKGASFAVVESVKAASEVYAPVSGDVLEVNDSLSDTPEAVNDSPYQDGWIAKIKLSNAGELEALMDANAYEDFLSES